jgi:hypothetical protein
MEHLEHTTIVNILNKHQIIDYYGYVIKPNYASKKKQRRRYFKDNIKKRTIIHMKAYTRNKSPRHKIMNKKENGLP